MNNRYKKNIGQLFNLELQEKLLTKNIGVIGCGGLGGYIIDFLTRLGVNSISFWDGDKYEFSNLNRQLGCTEKNIGKNKAKVIFNRMSEINSSIKLYAYSHFIGDKPKEDLNKLLSMDFIFIAYDGIHNVPIERSILKKTIEAGIPTIYSPINILGGLLTIYTKDDLSHFDMYTKNLLYQSQQPNLDEICSQTGYKCAILAGEAVNEMVKYFNNCIYITKNAELIIDIFHHTYSLSDKFGKIF